MEKYNIVRSFKTHHIQDKTLKKMKSYKVNLSKFIREAIDEKLDKEYHYLIPKIKIKKRSPVCQNLINQLEEVLDQY